MAKDYYFQHDYNPTNDPKIQAMLSDYGDWGYGMFWRIVEALHREESNTLPLKKYIFISFAQHKSTSVEQVETFVQACIETYELFAENDGRFFSNRVNANMKKRTETSESRSAAGKASAAARAERATLVQQNSTSVEQNPTKEKKRKERKDIKEGDFDLYPFSGFWDAYGKKEDRVKSETKWAKLTEAEKKLAIEAAPKYAARTPDTQYRKNPLTWLNGKCWIDEPEARQTSILKPILAIPDYMDLTKPL